MEIFWERSRGRASDYSMRSRVKALSICMVKEGEVLRVEGLLGKECEATKTILEGASLGSAQNIGFN